MAQSQDDDADALYKLAQAQHDRDEDRDAIDTVTRALDLRPDFVDALELRGFLYLLDGQPEQAFADLTRVLQLVPDAVTARGLRGEVYRAMKMPDEAIKDFSEAIRLNPEGRPAYVSRGLTYAGRGDRVRAIADLTVALRLRQSAYVYNERAACHYFSGDYARALADHTAACNLEPDDHATCNHLAWILATCPVAALRNGKRAVEMATKACELTGYKAAGYIDTLAAAHAEAGNFAEAVRLAEQAFAMVGPDRQADYQTRLDLYRAGQAFHTTANG